MNCYTRGCPPPAPGSRRAHCGGCHETFSGLTAFDKHQTLDGHNICLDPAERGLVQRPDGVWRTPGEMPNGIFPPSGDHTDGQMGVDGERETREALRDAQEVAQ